MNKVFVTGAAGFIGSHLVKKLAKEGNLIVVFVRKKSSLQFINSYIRKYNVEVRNGDITNLEETIDAMKGCNVVFHNAAFTADWGDRKDFYKINLEGTENILKAVEINKVKFVVLTSSTAVLGEEDNLEKKREEAPYKPNYPYFLSNIWESNMNDYRYTKMLSEKKAIDFCKKNDISLTVIRPVWVYGPREFHAGPYYFCKSVMEGTKFLPGCKTNKFHTIYVKDLADIMVRILNKKPEGINVFNVGPKTVPTMDEFWRLFCKYLNKNPPVYLPKGLVYPIGLSMEFFYKFFKIKKPPLLTRARVTMGYCNNVYDTSRIMKEIGYYKETSLEEGVKTTVKWWKINKYL
ncbi:MAG: NAD(P)-dependent oxidoreductase [bacterium]